MGLFNKMFSGVATEQIANEKDAFFAIIYASIAADGDVSDEEISGLLAIVGQKKIFRGIDVLDTYKRTVKLNQSVGGVEKLVELAAPKISEELKQTVFATSVDFMLADGVVGKKEETLLEKLSSTLGMDETAAMKIVEVILIKNKG